MDHHLSLLLGYAAGLAGWLLVSRLHPAPWRHVRPKFSHPWREVAWGLCAVAAVLLLGQAYIRGWLLPATSSHRPWLDAINQLIIFAPLPLLLVVRRQPLATAWLPLQRVWLRVALGIALALLSLAAFTSVGGSSDSWLAVVSRVYQPSNVSYLVQVLMEDMGIALLFVRLRAAAGSRTAIIATAVLFAAGHIPSLLAGGAATAESLSLLLDAALGIGIISVLQRSGDVWWFWGVHFAMDMMQFHVTA